MSDHTFIVPGDTPEAWVDLIHGLVKMAQHQNNRISPLHCEHDILYVQSDPEKFSEKDLRVLDDLGFHPGEHGFGFESFRFGSA